MLTKARVIGGEAGTGVTGGESMPANTRRRTGVWIAVAIIVLALIVLVIALNSRGGGGGGGGY